MGGLPPQDCPLVFGDFLESLRRQGFAIGVGDYLRLQQLLNKITGDCAPSDLKTLLCPLFATNKSQQEHFHRAFDSHFDLFWPSFVDKSSGNGEDDLSTKPQVIRDKFRSASVGRRSYAALALVLVIIMGFAFFVRAVRDRPSKGGPDQNKTPVGASEVTPSGGGITPGVPIEPGQTAQPSTVNSSSPEIRLSFYQRYKGFIYLGAISALLINILFYRWRARGRRKTVLQKRSGKKPPYTWPIRVAGLTARIYDSEQFYTAARLLRHRQVDEFHRLDVEGTIAATIEAVGYPIFRYKRDSKAPEYLVLIDRASFRDHQAQLFDELAKALEQEAIFILRFFYDEDPRLCSDETGEQIHLLELQRKYAGHRLLIFGNGERIVDPITGGLAPWSKVFSDWQDRAILTPTTPTEWTLREITLATQFIILPATLEGLLALVGHFELSETNDLRRWRQYHPESPSPAVDQPNSIGALRNHLGEESFQWLCACAIYPELHWDLTVYLGALPCMGANLVRQDNLIRLIRLPWFRTGAIPEDLRWLLIHELEPEKERSIRLAIVDLMEKNPPPRESFAADVFRLDLVVQRWLSFRNHRTRRELLRVMRALPQSQITRDYTVLRTLESARVSPVDFILPQRLRRLLFQNGISALGLTSGLHKLITLPVRQLAPYLTVLACATALFIYEDAYSPGPLSIAHASSEIPATGIALRPSSNSCSNCHQLLGGMQRRCADCHDVAHWNGSAASGFDPTISVAHKNSGVGCTDCHTEHAGANSQIKDVDNGSCISCHNNQYELKGRILGVPHGGTVGYIRAGDNIQWKGKTGKEALGEFHNDHPYASSKCGYCHVGSSGTVEWRESPRAACQTCHSASFHASGVEPIGPNCATCHKQHGRDANLSATLAPLSDFQLRQILQQVRTGGLESLGDTTQSFTPATIGGASVKRQAKPEWGWKLIFDFGPLTWYVWTVIVSIMLLGGLALLLTRGSNLPMYSTDNGAIRSSTSITGSQRLNHRVYKRVAPERLMHALGILVTITLAAATIIGILRYGMGERLLGPLTMRWITGLVGFVGIGAVMAYPMIYQRRAGVLSNWKLAHSFLGVITAIMLRLHSGAESGGALTTVLMWCFDAVILTGLLRIFCYLVAQRLLKALESPSLLINDLIVRREELRKELVAEMASYKSERLRSMVTKEVMPRIFSSSYLLRMYRENLDALLGSARAEFEWMGKMFTEDDESKLNQVIETATALRRVDALVFLHRVLNLWQMPHAVFTSIMLALMLVHIIQVIYYAPR